MLCLPEGKMELGDGRCIILWSSNQPIHWFIFIFKMDKHDQSSVVKIHFPLSGWGWILVFLWGFQAIWWRPPIVFRATRIFLWEMPASTVRSHRWRSSEKGGRCGKAGTFNGNGGWFEVCWPGRTWQSWKRLCILKLFRESAVQVVFFALQQATAEASFSAVRDLVKKKYDR